MNRPLSTRPPRSPHQQGAALIVAMLLLALMLTLGAGSLESARIEQRSAANLRDLAVAFEGAEAAAMDSLFKLRSLTAEGKAQADDSAGYYLNDSRSATTFDTVSNGYWARTEIGDANSMPISFRSDTYPDVTLGRYYIERLEDSQEGEPSSPNSYFLNYSRVTARAPGQIPGTTVTLQAHFVEVPN